MNIRGGDIMDNVSFRLDEKVALVTVGRVVALEEH
jgi:hypothetical protein